MPPVTIRKYFTDAGTDIADEHRTPAIGAPSVHSDDADDEISKAAMAYFASVQREAASLPFAVVAEYDQGITRSSDVPTNSSNASPSPRYPTELCRSVYDYFESLRELVNRTAESVEKCAIDISFEAGCAESELAAADHPSVGFAVERLAEECQLFSPAVVREYLWCILVYLELPLLEDTAASLQVLRRHCDTSGTTELSVCSLVISEFFHQRWSV
jgi:hypothetical protein